METLRKCIRLNLFFIGNFFAALLKLRWNSRFKHSVFIKHQMRNFPILVCIEGKSLLHVIFPVTFIFCPISVIENTISLPNSVCPVTLVAISKIFTLAFWLQPNMDTPSMLVVVVPFPEIFLSQICPIHGSLPFFHIILPIALEIVTRWIIVHLALTVFKIILKISFKNASTLKNYFSFALFFSFLPFTFICRIIDLINTISVPEPIFYFSFINASIRPLIYSLASDSIISKLPFIHDSIGPSKFPSSIEKAIIKISFIAITVFKCNWSLAIQAFPINLWVLWRYWYSSLPIRVENFRQLDW